MSHGGGSAYAADHEILFDCNGTVDFACYYYPGGAARWVRVAARDRLGHASEVRRRSVPCPRRGS